MEAYRNKTLTPTKNLKMPKNAPIQFVKGKEYPILKQDRHSIYLKDEQGQICTVMEVLSWHKHFVENKENQ